MNDQPLFARLLNYIEKYQLPLILGLLGVVFIGLGFLGPKISQPKKEEIVLESTKETEGKNIKVDVSGAVKNPGVYSLDEAARVSDAIAAAGGFSLEVDPNWVAKNVNLAAKLTDGQKLYVNTLADASSNTSTQILGTQTANSTININTASEETLDTLPGVGPVTAEKIISGRPYQKTEDLLNRKIVGQATYEKIKDKISVY
ncbi:MAG TPA: ComEA family DNA-binding protein [Candidatus Nanoarchaeia archaeon]|nr:ComE operon protein 1 [uncultured archaeon]